METPSSLQVGSALLFHPAGQQAVLFLNDIQLAVLAVAPDQVGGHVGSANGPDLALGFQFHQGRDGLFQREDAEVRALPVGVQHVNVVGAQALQALLHILEDAFLGQVAVDLHPVHHFVEDRRLVPPLQPAFGGEDDLVPVEVLQGFAHHFLAVVQAVNGGRVHPGDALLHGRENGFYGKGVVVVAPPVPPPMAQVPIPRNGADRPLLPILRFSIVIPSRQCPSPCWEAQYALVYFVGFLKLIQKDCGTGVVPQSSEPDDLNIAKFAQL